MRHVVWLVAALALAACSGDARDGSAVLVSDVESPAALAALPGGGFAYGERLTGMVVAVDADGRNPQPIIDLDVSTRGQQGLLGLVADLDSDHLFAAWTNADERLVVGRIDTGEVTIVWEGFAASDGANGGRLAFLPEGRLVVGVGTLRDSARVSEPDTVNGKMLSIDPAGPSDQTPVVLSSGWNNPYAFAVTPSGELWVADNDPGSAAERLARGDLGAEAGTDPEFTTLLPTTSAPAGMVAISNDELWVCGYVSRAMLRYRINDAGLAERSGTVTADCQLDVIQLVDGGVVFSTEADIRTIDP